MIYIEKLHKLRAFLNVRIPSSRELFARYGFSLVNTAHPDNTDPNHWQTPGNLQGRTILDDISEGGRIADRYVAAAVAADAAKAKQEAAAAAAEAAKASASSNASASE